ncbi:MAG: glycosyltransferase family 4 protein [Candidatus Sericytochromatia bacterium]|nr:glycosyltransferase family 4 protein [Candidatus Sericytochromatia bacterium]
MRIAMISPIGERVPPDGYGGTERIVSWLTEGLVARGHQVTLYASADSQTAAQLKGWPAEPLRGRAAANTHIAWEMAHLLRAEIDLNAFDVVHCHLGVEAAALTRSWRVPTLHTMHGGIFPHHVPLLLGLPDLTWVAISDSQRRPAPDANFAATIHHGLPMDSYPWGRDKDDYVVHLGRIAPEKGTHLAIDAACQAGVPLVIAAKVDPVDQAYFDAEIAPRLTHPHVHFIGEVGDAVKAALLRKARALLFPICWDEPFGIVLVEAMACGTPVIAYPRGSVPEIVLDGVTGILVNGVAEMAAAIPRADRLEAVACRAHVEERFSVRRMVRQYERIFADVASVALSA